MRSNAIAFGSVLQTMNDDRGCDRVLRTGFWTPSPSLPLHKAGATLVAIDTLRAARAHRAG